MIGNTFCSTGAFSRDPDLVDPKVIIDGIQSIECDGFELIFYPSFYESLSETQDTFRSIRDELRVLHTEKSIGPLLGTGLADDAKLAKQRLAINARFAADLGIERLVLHMWGLPDSDNHIERNLSHCADCVAIVESVGCHLSVESIPCLDRTPLHHLTNLMTRHDDINFTLDTEFLSMHEELNMAVKNNQILQRTDHVHIKDFNGSLVDGNGKRIYLHPGEGRIDFVEILSAIEKAPRVIDVCLESTSVDASGNVDYKQVQKDLSFIGGIVRSVSAKANWYSHED